MNVRTGIKAGQGLGDVIADFTHFTSLDQFAKLYEQVTGNDCGCEGRQEYLNLLLPLNYTTA